MCSLNFKNKKVTVVGLAKSGIAAAKLLKRLGAEVRVTEIDDNPEIRDRMSELEPLDIPIEIGGHDIKALKYQDLIVSSPGVPWESLPLKYANQRQISVIGELELGYLCCSSSIIAITGTNGKTTVSTMVYNILKAVGINSVLCGNVGIPFTQMVKEGIEDSFVILEVSSFQLEKIRTFHPFIGVLLNIDADHLDRHKDIDSYKSIKYNIFLNQYRNDWSIIVDPDFKMINKKSKSVFFTDGELYSNDICFYRDIKLKHYDQIFLNSKIDINKKVVLVILSLLGIDLEICLDKVLNFRNLEHRLEFVANINGVSFINDSKSTNISSANWALKRYDNVLLIAGGRNKNLDFNSISPILKKKIKYVFAIGEASQDIKKAFFNNCPVYNVGTLTQAVRESYNLASSGDNVLFSPMCASFDMFKDYKERGDRFREEVLKLNAS